MPLLALLFDEFLRIEIHRVELVRFGNCLGIVIVSRDRTRGDEERGDKDEENPTPARCLYVVFRGDSW